jgi:hypothetical protein
MQLLVSVRNAEEAAAALAGGADFIDAKEPSSGALGAVTLATLQRIAAAIAGARPVTAALGDAIDERMVARTAAAYGRAGANLVKIGFAGTGSRTRVAELIAAARDGAAEHTGVIACAYADTDRAGSLDPFAILDAAAKAGAAGALLDTADKAGPGLRALLPPAVLASWVGEARRAHLVVALAGQLTLDDLEWVQEAGPDIAGVRGAACEGGRGGRIAADKVRRLLAAARRSAPAPAPDPAAAYG